MNEQKKAPLIKWLCRWLNDHRGDPWTAICEWNTIHITTMDDNTEKNIQLTTKFLEQWIDQLIGVWWQLCIICATGYGEKQKHSKREEGQQQRKSTMYYSEEWAHWNHNKTEQLSWVSVIEVCILRATAIQQMEQQQQRRRVHKSNYQNRALMRKWLSNRVWMRCAISQQQEVTSAMFYCSCAFLLIRPVNALTTQVK